MLYFLPFEIIAIVNSIVNSNYNKRRKKIKIKRTYTLIPITIIKIQILKLITFQMLIQLLIQIVFLIHCSLIIMAKIFVNFQTSAGQLCGTNYELVLQSAKDFRQQDLALLANLSQSFNKQLDEIKNKFFYFQYA